MLSQPADPTSTTDAIKPKKIVSNKKAEVTIVHPGEFEAEKHFYPRVLNAHIHPLVSSFFGLGNKRIIARYTHLNPQVNIDSLKSLLHYSPKYFHWAGISS